MWVAGLELPPSFGNRHADRCCEVGRLRAFFWDVFFFSSPNDYISVYVGCGPLPVTVTTRIITFLVGDPYKPSFTNVTGRGPHPMYMCMFPSRRHVGLAQLWKK